MLPSYGLDLLQIAAAPDTPEQAVAAAMPGVQQCFGVWMDAAESPCLAAAPLLH